MQPQTNNIQSMILEDLNKGTARIYDGLVANVELPKLPEPIFVNYFLPCFLGKDQRQSWVAEWISIAGTPSFEVSIVDPVNGIELFRVPSFLSTQTVLIQKSKGTLKDVFDHAELMKNNSSGMAGLQFMNTELNNKANEALQSHHTDTSVRWNAILARYGIVQLGGNGQQVTVNDNDMFDYS